jgi:putative FmdB family regulatory protein
LPLYPYRCTQCGHRFEKIQKFGAKPEKACPKCGGALERPLTVPGLSFKGAGWYVNDYAAKSSTAKDGSSVSAAKSAPAENKAGTETKTESKAASGSDSTSAGSTSSAPAAASDAAAK